MTSQILSSGSYLPSRIVTNHELAQMFNTSDAWIQEKIGIKERRFAKQGEGVSDMAAQAAQKALQKVSLTAKDIDAIVFATSTPDYNAPGSGVLLQKKLRCREIPAFDIRNTSPGFLYSLDLADGLIQSDRYKTVLVVGAEVHSTGLDFSDEGRLMTVIFGDGCGCFLLQASHEKKGLQDFVLHSDGSYFDKLWCEGPSSLRNPRVSKEQIEEGVFYPKMDGRLVFQNAVEKMSSSIQKLLKKNQLKASDIDLFLSHQANLRIIKEIQKKFSLPDEKVPHNIEKYGNTSSASIPILYDELFEAGKIKTGQKIVMMSFGSGFCWGAGLIQT